MERAYNGRLVSVDTTSAWQQTESHVAHCSHGSVGIVTIVALLILPYASRHQVLLSRPTMSVSEYEVVVGGASSMEPYILVFMPLSARHRCHAAVVPSYLCNYR